MVIFAYNRTSSLEEVLNSIYDLRSISEVDIYIYSDGAKSEDEKEVFRVRKLISSFEDLFHKIIFREKNFGLKGNIVDGLGFISKQYEAFIVIEDDILMSESSLQYALGSLKKFKTNKQIAHINLWNYNIIDQNASYLSNYLHCWGWASWSDRWKDDIFNDSYYLNMSLYDKLRVSKYLSTLHYSHLYANLHGIKNTWAIYWLSYNIVNAKKCLSPPFSLVKNIGYTSGENTEFYSYKQRSLDSKQASYSITSNFAPEIKSWVYMFFKTPKIKLIKTLFVIFFK